MIIKKANILYLEKEYKVKLIPYGRQSISPEDIKLVSDSLKSDLITTGPYVNKLEKKIASLLKIKYAISCTSGTAGLHLVLLSINLKKDDVIIMPAINFVAVYSLCKLIGAKIFLADVSPDTGQMTPDSLLKCIKKNKIKKIKAIVTMYLGGYPQNINEFYKIKKKYKCYLIEDACHALGAKYKIGKTLFNIGSCAHSDFCVFSLHPLKTITSGEGGLITTNNQIFREKIKLLRSHGIIKSCHWKYDIKFPALNYRLSDINCALALSQLKRIKKLIFKRKEIFNLYKNFFSYKNDILSLPNYKDVNHSSFHLFLIKIDFKKLIKNKDFFIKEMLKKKIMIQFHYIPIFCFKNIYNSEFQKKEFPGSLSYQKTHVSLPIYVGLEKKKIEYVVKKINLFIKKYEI